MEASLQQYGTPDAGGPGLPPHTPLHQGVQFIAFLPFHLAWAAVQVYHTSRAAPSAHVPAHHMPILLAWGRGLGGPDGGTVRALRGAVQRCGHDSTTTNIHVASLSPHWP